MRHIVGYVCIAKLSGRATRFVFGPAVSEAMSDVGYESFVTNGLMPFNAVDQAERARGLLRARKSLSGIRTFSSVVTKKLTMQIAEIHRNRPNPSEENWDPVFVRSRQLVMVVDGMGVELLGRAVEGLPRTCNETCADFFTTGLRTFDSHHSLMSGPYPQTLRLTGCLVRLATFELRRAE